MEVEMEILKLFRPLLLQVGFKTFSIPEEFEVEGY